MSRHTATPRRPRRRALAAVASLAALVLVGGGALAAQADSPQADGAYACSFTAGTFGCSPTVLPTVSVTSTVTQTATATTTATVPGPTATATVTASAPPCTSKVLVGSSFSGSSAAAVQSTTAMFPEATVGRFYFSGDPTTFANSPGLSAIPAAETIFVSFKTSVASVKSGAYDAAFQAILRDWNASGRTIYWTWQHEADDPAKSIAPADYVAGWTHLLADERAVPNPKVHSMTILMAYALTAGAPHGNPESWYVPGVDVLGFDSYNLNTEVLAENYATSKGKALAFPEFGDGVVAGQTDAQSLAFAQSFVAGFTSNVFGAAWFNQGNNDLSTRPQTVAYLRTQP